jgi:hypothetical protein
MTNSELKSGEPQPTDSERVLLAAVLQVATSYSGSLKTVAHGAKQFGFCRSAKRDRKTDQERALSANPGGRGESLQLCLEARRGSFTRTSTK